MWRADPAGPQGPMQVSAAAAADAGGGDRFDENQNHALGCSYLARLYRRYGNWPDAIAAYNWGPGRMDFWINDGRSIDKFPAAVDRYRTRVLVISALPGAGPINARLERLGMLRLEAKQQMADRHRPAATVPKWSICSMPRSCEPPTPGKSCCGPSDRALCWSE